MVFNAMPWLINCRAAAVLVMLLLLGACSTPGRSYTATGMTETLETSILANGSKMFVYRLRLPEDQVPSHIQVARSGAGVPEAYKRQRVNVNRYAYERVQENAAHVTASFGYCRDGFLELDGSVSRYHMWLKGECREEATAEDRSRFGEQQVLKVEPKY